MNSYLAEELNRQSEARASKLLTRQMGYGVANWVRANIEGVYLNDAHNRTSCIPLYTESLYSVY